MNDSRIFHDRREAGRALAEQLLKAQYNKPVVLALPRGGVPIGVEVAMALNAPLDLVLVRKIGVPDQPELAVAAVVDGDEPEMVVNQDIQIMAHVSTEYLNAARDRQLAEIDRRRKIYLAGRARVPVEGCTAIVVDDGIATGATVRASLKAVRRRHPAKLVLAVPVAPERTVEELRADVDEIICLQSPEPFHAIGPWYRDFHQVGDDEVVAMLKEAKGGLKEPSSEA